MGAANGGLAQDNVATSKIKERQNPCPSHSMTKVDRFWSWFEENREELARAEPEEIAEELDAALNRVDERLAVEVAKDATGIEVIISANGDREAFPVVRSLVRSANSSKRWKFVGLKPPRGFDFKLDVEGASIEADKLSFDPLEGVKNPKALGIRLFGLDVESELNNVNSLARLIVETGIGEELAAQIDYIDARPASEAVDTLPIAELLAYVEWYLRKRVHQK
jgi:hypothetical protein